MRDRNELWRPNEPELWSTEEGIERKRKRIRRSSKKVVLVGLVSLVWLGLGYAAVGFDLFELGMAVSFILVVTCAFLLMTRDR